MLDALSISKQYGSPIIPKLCNMRAVAFLSDGTRRGDQLMKYSSFCSKRKTKVAIFLPSCSFVLVVIRRSLDSLNMFCPFPTQQEPPLFGF